MPVGSLLRVLVVQGGPSSEHEVSLRSGANVFKHLDRSKYLPELATIHKDGMWQFNPNLFWPRITQEEALQHVLPGYDVAFLALHGAFGEDGTIQKILGSIGLPYTGSGPGASATAMDKEASAEIFSAFGLLVPMFLSPFQPRWPIFPVIVKPCHGGSSIGVSVVHSASEADAAAKEIRAGGDSVVVQPFVQGREFTCGVLENEEGNLQALPPTEIIPMGSIMFDYHAKYTPGASQEVTPPDLPEERIKDLQDYALMAHRVLGCRGMSRSDFILHQDLFYILETNTIPGMTPTSLLPQQAAAAGITFPQMLDRIIASALRRR